MKRKGFGDESIASIGTALSVNTKAHSASFAIPRVGDGKDDSRCNLFTEEDETSQKDSPSMVALNNHRASSAYERSVKEAMHGIRLPSPNNAAAAEEPLLSHSRSSTEGLAVGKEKSQQQRTKSPTRNSFSALPSNRQEKGAEIMANGAVNQPETITETGRSRGPLKFTDVGQFIYHNFYI
jgi:CRISPR/Cas system CMR-associated protein Cmr5 small subunit